MDFKKEQFTIFIILVTEVLGFSLILPFLPLYAKGMGMTPFQIGLILASYSLFQFISAPIMGNLSDKYGRKPLLIISQVSTFIGFMVLGFATTPFLIFLSRVIDGLFGSNFTIANAYLSDISKKKDRSKIFGITGAAFGFGFLFGPATGGLLMRYGFYVPCFMAAALSLISILLTHFLLKETVKKNKEILRFKAKKYFQDKKVAPHLYQFFFFIVSHMMFTSTFALYASSQLSLTEVEIGLSLAWLGFNNIIMRGILLSRLIDFFGEKKLIRYGMIIMAASLIASAFITDKVFFLLGITFFAIGNSATRPVLIGMISKKVSSKEQGAVLGVSNSLASLAQMIGPLIGGYLLTILPSYTLPLASAAALMIGILFLKR
ncbi:MAG: MFS transporter [Candidatus Woesearchaeota archaeon]|nr:MFS transporter [Candidatus Woesearchaeota archaeon]